MEKLEKIAGGLFYCVIKFNAVKILIIKINFTFLMISIICLSVNQK